MRAERLARAGDEARVAARGDAPRSCVEDEIFLFDADRVAMFGCHAWCPRRAIQSRSLLPAARSRLAELAGSLQCVPDVPGTWSDGTMKNKLVPTFGLFAALALG